MNAGIQLKLGFGHKQKAKQSLLSPKAPAHTPVQTPAPTAPAAKQAVQESPAADPIKKKTLTAEEKTFTEKTRFFWERKTMLI